MNPKLINRINELAKLSKQRKLTNDETKEQAELRKEYIQIFKGKFKQHLEGLKIIDEKGNKVNLKNKNKLN